MSDVESDYSSSCSDVDDCSYTSGEYSDQDSDYDYYNSSDSKDSSRNSSSDDSSSYEDDESSDRSDDEYYTSSGDEDFVVNVHGDHGADRSCEKAPLMSLMSLKPQREKTIQVAPTAAEPAVTCVRIGLCGVSSERYAQMDFFERFFYRMLLRKTAVNHETDIYVHADLWVPWTLRSDGAHQSLLFSVYPGEQVTASETPRYSKTLYTLFNVPVTRTQLSTIMTYCRAALNGRTQFNASGFYLNCLLPSCMAVSGGKAGQRMFSSQFVTEALIVARIWGAVRPCTVYPNDIYRLCVSARYECDNYFRQAAPFRRQ